MRRALLPLAAFVLLLAMAMTYAEESDATFTDLSSRAVTVAAAQDWTPPTVAVTDPGSAVSGTATIAAIASDARGTIASVRIEASRIDSAVWTPLCTDTTAPYSCSWTTTAVADGTYELRATAVDSAGLSAMSETVTTRVINTAAVVLARIPSVVRGSTTLRADYVNGGTTTAGIYFQYTLSGGTSWTNVPGCGPEANVLRTTRTCAWDTTSLTEEYDVRAVATVGLTTLTDVQAGIVIDNTAPTVTLTVPPNPLTGTITLSATAADGDSGMASVTFRHRRTGTTTWTVCGVDTDDPWRCALDTLTLANGSWEFQAVAADVAGNTTTTATQTRTVDNTVSSVSVTQPAGGDVLQGIVTVGAAANSTAGVANVALQARPAGGAWTTLCTDGAAPYACSWDTLTAANGAWELRAVLTDGAGGTLTSSMVAVTVENTPLRAADVQVTNVATSGQVAAGDRITLTYSTLVDLTTVKAGWTGASTPLGLVYNDKNVAGAPLAGYDWASFTGANLGRLSLTQNFVKSRKSATFTATMTAATVDGRTVITVTLGSTSNTNNLGTVSTTGTTRWYPSTAVRTTTGVASSGAVAIESGAVDKDF